MTGGGFSPKRGGARSLPGRSWPLIVSSTISPFIQPPFSPLLLALSADLTPRDRLSMRDECVSPTKRSARAVARPRGSADPGSTTRTNIKPETAIRRPECGSPPRTSPYAGDACVAFKPTPKPTPYLYPLLTTGNELSSSLSPMAGEDHSSLLVPRSLSNAPSTRLAAAFDP